MASVPTSIVVFEVLIILFIGYRSVLNYRGRSFSIGRMVVFPFLVALLYLSAEAETAITIPWSYPLWTILDAVLLVVASAVIVPLAPRIIKVYRGPDGNWRYRFGLELIGVYLAIWVVRLALALYYDPSSLEFTVGPAPVLPPAASDVMQLVQALFSISSGLVIGRAVGALRLYAEAHRREPTPLPSGRGPGTP